MKIFTFDTTLRDGTQGESVSLSVDDKLVIAQRQDLIARDLLHALDDFRVPHIPPRRAGVRRDTLRQKPG